MSVEKAYLFFIPLPVMSHLVAAVKAAALLADRDDRLAITVFIMNLPITDPKIASYTKNSPNSRINFVQLQENKSISTELKKSSPKTIIPQSIESQKGAVIDAVSKIIESQKSGRLAGFVLDIFCTAMINVANKLGAPAYVFFSSGAACLGLTLHLQSLIDDHDLDLTEYDQNSDAVVSVPTYINPVPARVWPSTVFYSESGFLELARNLRQTKGIMINTFLEFEPHAISSLSADGKIPPVYPVGPILQDEREENDERYKHKRGEIIRWLDEQPNSSVVFLCFGTNGSFDEDQVKEIAVALENCGHRFLWSLRKPPPKERAAFPGEYENPGEVLPEGFLERTAGIGKVIGWAPQMAVLAHPAVGGFVSHCGWNSTLESIWCGVPMAVWPLAAEQQVNSFELVRDFEMAVEVKMDYRKDSGVIVGAEIIGKAIRSLMDPENVIRVRVKEMREKSRKALMKGGSSYDYLGRLIDRVMDNVS